VFVHGDIIVLMWLMRSEVSWSTDKAAQWESQQSALRCLSWGHSHCKPREVRTWCCELGESSEDFTEPCWVRYVMPCRGEWLRYHPGCLWY